MNAITVQDSREENLKHIENVRSKIMKVVMDLIGRAIRHDATKLDEPEKSMYDKYGFLLGTLEYGSDAYKDILKKMKPAIDHHYSSNRHHPEYFADGINGMNLVDLMEMLVDWKAAGERHTKYPGDIFKSIEMNTERFHIDPQLKQILLNTATYLWYE